MEGYPLDELRQIFDELVISGEVGMRKPDPDIYLDSAERIGRAPSDCAFVDDLDLNVDAARRLGMFGVHHVDAESTAEQLETFLGVPLRTDARRRD